MTVADPDWVEAWEGLLPTIVQVYEELYQLHVEKSGTYGDDEDRLANFTRLADRLEMDWEAIPVIRMGEKQIRVENMIADGLADDVKEYKDIASLALCAEALRRRRRGT